MKRTSDDCIALQSCLAAPVPLVSGPAILIGEIRNRFHAQPFRAFTVHVSNGTQVNIHHYDYGWLLPSGGELHVEDSHGKVHLIDTAQISQLSYDAPQESPASAR